MKTEGTSKTEEEAAKEEKTEGPQGFAEMCRQMMSGKLSEYCGAATGGTTPGATSGCCGPRMQEMMARMMGVCQANAE